MPEDTLGGLELRYGVPLCVIRRLNHMSSDRLNSHIYLKIPVRAGQMDAIHCPKDDFARRARTDMLLKVMFPNHTKEEIDYYMDESGGDVLYALKLARADREWQQNNKKLLRKVSSKPTKSGVKRRRSLLAWTLRLRRQGKKQSSMSLNEFIKQVGATADFYLDPRQENARKENNREFQQPHFDKGEREEPRQVEDDYLDMDFDWEKFPQSV